MKEGIEMSEITVTLPLSKYNEMKRTIEEHHVKNFIRKEYSDYRNNEYSIVMDHDKIQQYLGGKMNNHEV